MQKQSVEYQKRITQIARENLDEIDSYLDKLAGNRKRSVLVLYEDSKVHAIGIYKGCEITVHRVIEERVQDRCSVPTLKLSVDHVGLIISTDNGYVLESAKYSKHMEELAGGAIWHNFIGLIPGVSKLFVSRTDIDFNLKRRFNLDYDTYVREVLERGYSRPTKKSRKTSNRPSRRKRSL